MLWYWCCMKNIKDDYALANLKYVGTVLKILRTWISVCVYIEYAWILFDLLKLKRQTRNSINDDSFNFNKKSKVWVCDCTTELTTIRVGGVAWAYKGVLWRENTINILVSREGIRVGKFLSIVELNTYIFLLMLLNVW